MSPFWADASLGYPLPSLPPMPCGQRLRSNRPGPFYFRALGKANYDGAVADSNRKIIAALFLRKIKSGHSATKAVLLLDAVSFPSVLDFTDDDYQYGRHHDRSDQRCQRREHFFCSPPSDDARIVQSESLFQGRCEYSQAGSAPPSSCGWR